MFETLTILLTSSALVYFSCFLDFTDAAKTSIKEVSPYDTFCMYVPFLVLVAAESSMSCAATDCAVCGAKKREFHN